MSDLHLSASPSALRTLPAPSPRAGGDLAAELCALVFSALPRSDQRERAEQYLHGLLTARGRKSIRNIAAAFGSSAAEQALHHFVSKSTWDWMPVREALARYLDARIAPQAWVVQLMTIPKAGQHSVGVGRRFVPQLGQTVDGQQAYGLWYAAPGVSAPIDWRLFLPGAWVRDPGLRKRVDIPCDIGEESLEACGVATILNGVRRWGLTPRPVLIDLRMNALPGPLRELGAAGVPVVARISGSERLVVADPAMPGYGSGALPAQRVLRSISGLCRPPRARIGTPVGAPYTAGIRVFLPGLADRSGPRPMRLFGEWTDPTRPPARLWLSDLTAQDVRAPERLTALADQAAEDCVTAGDTVGLRDFEGRSFRGWHRHITLASLAHTVRALTEAPEYPPELTA